MVAFRIKELIEESKRAGKKVTQTGLAKAAGISQTSIWKIVEGKTKAPAPQILLAIAGVFTEALGREITIDDLIEKGSKETPDTQPEPERTPEPASKDDDVLQAIAQIGDRMDKGFAEVNQQMKEIQDAIDK